MELRPFTGNDCIAVGASLCGGKAYQQVATFVADCARLCGANIPEDLYDRLNHSALSYQGTPVRVRPTFSGTRREPGLLGEISGIGRDNMTCASLLRGTVDGMLRELYALYAPLSASLPPVRHLIGSGNAIRRNPALRMAAEAMFGLPISLLPRGEEAAMGAALAGGVGCGMLTSMAQASALIRYDTADTSIII